MWALFKGEEQISKSHSTRWAAMAEAYERGVVAKGSIGDFEGDPDLSNEKFLFGGYSIKETEP